MGPRGNLSTGRRRRDCDTNVSVCSLLDSVCRDERKGKQIPPTGQVVFHSRWTLSRQCGFLASQCTCHFYNLHRSAAFALDMELGRSRGDL